MLLGYGSGSAPADAQAPVDGAAPRTAGELALDGGAISVRLSAERQFDTALAQPSIAEDAAGVWLHVESSRRAGTRVAAEFTVEEAVGYTQGQSLRSDSSLMIGGDRWSLAWPPPVGGFEPGRYRATVSVENGPRLDLVFAIVGIAPPAELLTRTNAPVGFNIALRELGGRVERASSEQNASNWAAANLLDGFSQIYDRRGRQTSSGWLSSPGAALPAEVVLSFRDRKPARIAAVILDAITTIEGTDGATLTANVIPKHVEIWTGMSDEDSAFTRVAAVRLRRELGLQAVRFEPVEARFVKVRILSTFGASDTGFGEILVIEAPGPDGGILADVDLNLAAPPLGGGVVSITSQDADNSASALFDGVASLESGWLSAASSALGPGYFPQDFVISFAEGRTAYVDRVVLDPVSSPRYSAGDFTDHWVKSVSIGVSTAFGAAFEEVARVAIPKTPGPVDIPVRRDARFIRLRVLENHGGAATTLGELRVIEGRRAGYDSILRDGASRAYRFDTNGVDRSADGAAAGEPPGDGNEPNDSPDQAKPLALRQRVRGTLDSPADLDYFAIDLPGTAPQAVTWDVTGRPSVRTSLTLIDGTGGEIKRFAPAGDLAETTRFTWLVEPGAYHLRVDEPPLNAVLVWDTSGSMRGRTAALEAAVRGYLSGVRAGERVQLVRFAQVTQALMEDFSGDPAVLARAVEGQFPADGATAVIDAVLRGLALTETRVGRRAIVVFTDGQDTASEAVDGEVWRKLAGAETRIYAIGLGQDLMNYGRRTAGTGHQFLGNLAGLTNGRYYYARDASDLAPIFEDIARDLRARPSYELTATAATELGSVRVVSAGERIPSLTPPRFELVLDASGSMRARVADGRTRMAVAQQALRQVLAELPDGIEVGLRVFGHRIAEGRPGDCEDTELLVPFGPLDRDELATRIDGIQALGTTLIAHALEQTAADFGPSADERVIVLVTDGEEECREDLRATVERLNAGGLRVSLNIVGFAVGDANIAAELAALARIGSGRFVAAGNAEELGASLEAALRPAFEVLDGGGTVVATGSVDGDSVPVPIGIYTVAVRTPGAPLVFAGIDVGGVATTVLELRRHGEVVDASAP